MSAEIGKYLDEVVREIKKYGVDAVYLFGSYATGRVKPTSDIDVCVITKKDIPKVVKEKILSNSSKKIDIVLFWDLPNPIRFRVLKEGKLLYERDRSALYRIKINTLRSYLDMQPMIRRNCLRILGG